MELVVFLIAGFFAIVGALGLVIARNPVHSALSLVMSLFAVAVLFPTYWLLELDITFSTGVRRMAFGGLDMLNLVVGLLSAYVWWGLRKILNEQNGYRGADTLLIIIVVASLLYTGAMFASSVIAALNTDAFVIGGTALALVLFGVLDIVLAVVLLRDGAQLPGLVKAFAVANLIHGVCEVSILMSWAVLVLYPVTVVILAILFLRKPEEVEFV